MCVLLVVAMLSGCSKTSLKKDAKSDSLEKTTIDSFSSIKVDVDVASIDLIPEANAFAIEYHIVNQDVDYSVKDGALTLIAKGGKNVTVNSDDISYIKIYVPKGAAFTSIECDADVGDIKIEKINVDDMTIHTAVGNATFSDINVNKQLSIETEVGNIEVSLTNADSSYNIKADMAEVMINGKKFSGVDIKKSHTSKNGPQVDLATQTGNIKFDYK